MNNAITRLYLDNCFRHFNKTILFEAGLTAITGANECGKSLILEMIRYALFGTKALRGKASDYKTLHVELDFTVRGTSYRVVRKAGKAQLFMAATMDELAVGTTAVNAKIISIFGYDLVVFDIAHICNQGKVEELSSMKPSERKSMVDQTVGLTTLDGVDSGAQEEARNIRKVCAMMQETLREPIEPTKPAVMRASTLILAELNDLLPSLNELHEVRGRLKMPEPVAPVLPTCSISATSAEIKASISALDALQKESQGLRLKIAAIPALKWTKEEYDALVKQYFDYELGAEKRSFIGNGKVPQYTLEQLKQWIADLGVREQAVSLATQQANLLRAMKALEGSKIKCVNCDHEQHIEERRYQELKAEHDALVVPDVMPDRPPLSLVQIKAEIDKIELYGERWEFLKDTPDVEKPAATRDELNAWADGYEKRQVRQQLILELAGVTSEIQKHPIDLTSRLHERMKYEYEMETYEQRLKTYDTTVAARTADKLREAVLAPIPGFVEALRAEQAEAERYEMAYSMWVTQRAEYDKRVAELQAKEAEADELDRARKALKAIRSRVKEHLVPSLSAVASRLLSEMTGGQRTSIDVNEDFEITVDGQDVDTLSGSGKAVANLALRIGLGQVLTNKVFPLFMGDEVDAAMDQSRAESTAAALRNLSGSIAQVVVVSHKTPEADNYIQLM